LSRQLTVHVRWIVGATTDDGRPVAAVAPLKRPILVSNISSTIADDAEGRGAGYTTVESKQFAVSFNNLMLSVRGESFVNYCTA